MAYRKIGLTRQITIWTLVLLLSFTSAIIFTNIRMNLQLDELRVKINNKLEQEYRIQDVENHYRSMVSNARGYFAYGRDDFLNQVDIDRKSIEEEVSVIEQSPNMEWKEKSRLHELKDLFTKYEGNFDTAKEWKKNGDNQAITSTATTTVLPLIEDIQRRLDELVMDQRADIQNLFLEEKRLRTFPVYLSIGTVLGAFIIASLLIRYLRRSVVFPVQEMERVVHEIGQGRYETLDIKGRNDEIGNLQNGINQMIVELNKRYEALQGNLKQMAQQNEEVEAKNEEILAQQISQQETLEKLIEREKQLRLINMFQENLTGQTQLSDFLANGVPALLQSLRCDAAAVVLNNADSPTGFKVFYSYGYPVNLANRGEIELFGPAQRVVNERRRLSRERSCTGVEQGIHDGYAQAIDRYFPLYSDDFGITGFLLITSYGTGRDDALDSLAEGLVSQFAVAFFAQLAIEEKRKETEKENRHNALIQKILESIHDGMLLCDRHGTVIFTNLKTGKYLGVASMFGRSIYDLSSILPSSQMNNIKSILAGEVEQLHEQFSIELSGECQYFELFANSVMDQNNETRYLFILRNRTDEERSNQLKDEFISIVSHELRTPLASVLGYIEILLNRELPAPRQKKYLETVYQEAGRLSSLINDFLDLQRMEAGKQKYYLIPMNISELISEVAAQWQGRKIRLDIPNDGMVIGDRDRLTQVLHNLISNAIKYSPGAEWVDIRMHVEQPYWVIEIQDYGLGIPEEARQFMFKKFYRVDNSDRRQIGGTGLGLAIVKEIMDDHGGIVSYDSVFGQGSTFRLELPAFEAISLSGKIVIVEDDGAFSEMIAGAFEHWHLPTQILKSAEEVLACLNETQMPALLFIVDVHLRGIQDGLGLVSEILSNEVQMETPIIVSSIDEKPEHFVEKRDKIFLRKPIGIEKLLELAKSLISMNERNEK